MAVIWQNKLQFFYSPFLFENYQTHLKYTGNGTKKWDDYEIKFVTGVLWP